MKATQTVQLGAQAQTQTLNDLKHSVLIISLVANLFIVTSLLVIVVA